MKSKISLPSNPSDNPAAPFAPEATRRRRDRGASESPRTTADRYYEAGREMRDYVDKGYSGHFALGWVGERIARDFKVYFEGLRDVHLELALLNPGTPAYECGLAIDVWVAISIWWMQESPCWRTLVPLVLYKYMRAGEAPLPDNYEDADATRKRVQRDIERAIDPAGGISLGWRLNWLGRYPATFTTLNSFYPLRKRRDRLIHATSRRAIAQ